MAKFVLDQVAANISKANLRTENHGPEDKVLGVDLNIAADVSAHELGQFAFDEDVDWRDFLFDEKGQPKRNGLVDLKFDREFEEHIMLISTSGLQPETGDEYVVTLKKFKAKPVFGNAVKLSFQAQVHPHQGDLDKLANGLLHDCYLTVMGPVQADFVDAEEESEEMAV